MTFNTIPQLPTAEQVQMAVRRYLAKAYAKVPARLEEQFCPPPDVDLVAWLMRDDIERLPDTQDLQQVKAFNLRMGNQRYRYMKLRIARPPGRDFFVFTVDAHDAILQAPAGSPDEAELTELKRYNTQLCQEILDDWDHAGLFTERTYLRQEIDQAKLRQGRR